MGSDKYKMINILYVFDENYAPYAGISIMTLLNNNPNDFFVIFCCVMDVSEDNRNKIQNIVDLYNQTLVWIDSKKTEEYINSCNTGYWNGSKATWMKVFVLWELPDCVDRIIYLDCDTLIHEGIRELYEIKLDNYPLAMARDSLGNTNGQRRYGTSEYRNAGVIVFDVNYWKGETFKKQFLDCLINNVSLFIDNEQGLLNYYFKDHIQLLPLKYNMQGFLLLYNPQDYLSVYNDCPFYEYDEIIEAICKPTVSHFFRVFGQYPWELNNHHPNRGDFEKQKSISLWRETAIKKTKVDVTFRIEYILYRVLPSKAYLRLYRYIVERYVLH